jgi:DNA-binding transcriptional regulator PaaX
MQSFPKSSSLSSAILECLASGGDEVFAGFINPRKTMYYGRDRVIRDYFGDRAPSQVRRSLQSLEQKGAVKRSGRIYEICDRGWSMVLMNRMKDADLYDDMRMLMIIFDVPESRKADRDRLRRLLLNAGCGLLQKSVYITPFDVLADLKEVLKQTKLDGCVKMYFGKPVQ